MIQDQYFGALHKDAVAEVSSGQWLWPLQGVANRDLKLENLLLDRDGSDGTRRVHQGRRTAPLCLRTGLLCLPVLLASRRVDLQVPQEPLGDQGTRVVTFALL